MTSQHSQSSLKQRLDFIELDDTARKTMSEMRSGEVKQASTEGATQWSSYRQQTLSAPAGSENK